MMKLAARRNLMATTMIAGSLMAAPAFAQTAPAADVAAEGETIVVTGSLISNPNLVRSSPVNVTTADEINLKQSNVAEQILREIPGIVPNIGSAVNNGNGGASFVDLRGLGSNRNIVLLDGRRIAPSGLVGRVDLNNIPVALVDRVDVLTGGASTTYGADAISGVVNFITKSDFAGVEASFSEQITERGDGNTFRADLTLGANFDDGRGNAVFSIGYQESDAVYQGDRDFSANNLDSYTGISGGGSGTSIPSRLAGTRPLTTAGTPNTTPESIFTGRGAVSAAFPLGAPIYAANPGGAANGGVRQVNTTTGQAVTTFQFFNFNPYNIFNTPFERYNMYGAARYEVSDAVEVYTRGLFSKNTVQTIIAPSGVFGTTVNINLNNPYLPSALRNQLCAFDVNPRPDIYTPRFTPTECTTAATSVAGTAGYRVIGTGGFVAFDVNNNGTIEAGEGYNPNTQITVNRRTTEAGPRISNFRTTIFDYTAGVRGNITDTIKWDVSGGYGESENVQTLQGYIRQSLVRQAAIADNTTTCTTNTGGCVPINLFGPENSISAAQVAFLVGESQTIVRTTLAQARATVVGDFGVAIPLAADPISFAVGGEYRKYTAEQRSDILSQMANELGGGGGAAPNITGGYDVYEAFGELVAPLVQDKPFFKSLTLEAGVRYSSYKVDAPTKPSYDTTTYKAGGSWEPGAGLRIRGNYSRAVRAPNISELFSPVNTTLTTLNTDPCAGAAPNNNANLRAVCLAQGAPVGTIGSILNPTAGQAQSTGGGNINIKPETSDSYTVGAVFQPEFIPGLSISADYYNIRVKGAITTPTPGDAITSCFGTTPTSPSASAATSLACTQIRRNPVTGGLDGTPDTTPGLFLSLSNQGLLKTDGIDVSVNYRRDVGVAKVALSFTGNYTMSSNFKSNAADPNGLDRNCTGYYSPNCASIQPEFQFSQRTTLTFGDIDISLLWRYMSAVQFEPQQFANDLAAALAAPTACPDPNGVDAGGCLVDPAYRNIKAANYFDLSTRFSITDNLTLTLTLQNLLDRQPPIVGSLVGSTAYNSGNTYPSSYDALGRRFAAAVKLKF